MTAPPRPKDPDVLATFDITIVVDKRAEDDYVAYTTIGEKKDIWGYGKTVFDAIKNSIAVTLGEPPWRTS